MSNFIRNTCDLLNHRLPDPTPAFLIQWIWGGVWWCAFLSSQVMLILRSTSTGFPGGLDRRLSWIPGLGRSSGEGNGNPAQYSSLETAQVSSLSSTKVLTCMCVCVHPHACVRTHTHTHRDTVHLKHFLKCSMTQTLYLSHRMKHLSGCVWKLTFSRSG